MSAVYSSNEHASGDTIPGCRNWPATSTRPPHGHQSLVLGAVVTAKPSGEGPFQRAGEEGGHCREQVPVGRVSEDLATPRIRRHPHGEESEKVLERHLGTDQKLHLGVTTVPT